MGNYSEGLNRPSIIYGVGLSEKKYVYTALNDFTFVIMEGNDEPKVEDGVTALTLAEVIIRKDCVRKEEFETVSDMHA